MIIINQIASIKTASESEGRSQAESINRLAAWFKSCYGDRLIYETIQWLVPQAISDELSEDKVNAHTAEQHNIKTIDELCLILDQLFQSVDIFLVEREVFSCLTPEHAHKLINALKSVDWVIPPILELPEGMIPHFVVVEELQPQRFVELDWGVQLARFAEGRLTVLYPLNHKEDAAVYSEPVEREYHRRLIDKIAQTDYRTLERGTQLRIFPTDTLAALSTIEAEYPPWLTIIPQTLASYDDFQTLNWKSGMLFLSQT